MKNYIAVCLKNIRRFYIVKCVQSGKKTLPIFRMSVIAFFCKIFLINTFNLTIIVRCGNYPVDQTVVLCSLQFPQQNMLVVLSVFSRSLVCTRQIHDNDFLKKPDAIRQFRDYMAHIIVNAVVLHRTGLDQQSQIVSHKRLGNLGTLKYEKLRRLRKVIRIDAVALKNIINRQAVFAQKQFIKFDWTMKFFAFCGRQDQAFDKPLRLSVLSLDSSLS